MPKGELLLMRRGRARRRRRPSSLAFSNRSAAEQLNIFIAPAPGAGLPPIALASAPTIIAWRRRWDHPRRLVDDRAETIVAHLSAA